MNKELLLKVADAIEANPAHFDMDDFFQNTECGTTACIAGWALFLESGKEKYDEFFLNHANWTTDYGQKLGEAVGIPYYTEEFDHLCMVESWTNTKLRRAYKQAVRPKTKAKIAAQYVRWFVENAGEF